MDLTKIRQEAARETAYKRICAVLLHRLETFHDDHAHVYVSLGTVGEATGLAGAEFAPGGASDAFVPAQIRQFTHHLTDHSFLLLLLNSQRNLNNVKILFCCRGETKTNKFPIER